MCRARRRDSSKPSNTADANLAIVRLLKTHLFTLILDFEKSTEYPDLVSVSKERDAEEREITILS